MRARLNRVFRKIAEDFGFDPVELEVAKKQVPVFLNSPQYSIAKVVGIFKNISARKVIRENPELQKHLRKQSFW
ncbi:transposase [Candidatus Nitrospira neomarina]|uniref:transposase n=1 Tax=Candidatus Nitrospira neomarina TaxID=3020899 RepID=UPI0035E3DDA0